MANLAQLKKIRKYEFFQELIDTSLVKKLKKTKYLNTKNDLIVESRNYEAIEVVVNSNYYDMAKLCKHKKLIKLTIRDQDSIFLNILDVLRLSEDLTEISSILRYCELRNIKIRELEHCHDLYENYLSNIEQIDEILNSYHKSIETKINKNSLIVLKYLNEKASKSIGNNFDKRFFCSIRYISKYTSLSKSTVQRCIKNLVINGYLKDLNETDLEDLRELEKEIKEKSEKNNFYKPVSIFEISDFKKGGDKNAISNFKST